MLKALPFILVLLLAGCMTQKEREEKLAAAEDEKCKSFGLQFGTPQYAECRMKFEQMRSNERAAIASAPYTPTQTNCTSIGNTTHCNSY